MSTNSFKDIEKFETDLWEAADNLRANSKLTSSDYFMPVLGVIFLRHAANRFETAHRQIEADRAGGKMPKRKVLPADYIARRSLYLPEKARYDWIMQQAALSEADLTKLVTEAMTAIEEEFQPLKSVLPKDYGIFEPKVLEDLMRLFNSEQIKQATGDVFGRIWEDGAITWITPTDVTRNAHFVLLDSEKKITEAGLQNSSAKLVPPHAILMTSRASVGFFAVTGREVCTNQGFISIVLHDPILWPYFLYHLSERVEEIRAMGSGSTYPEVSRGKFRELKVLLPKHSLATAFCEHVTDLLKQIRLLKQQNDKLRTARDLLLPRLMSGEIAV